MTTVLGVEVEDLYTATAQVNSRTDERERQRAFAQALREVLVKVSGQSQVLQISSIRRALNRPDDYVESWAYSSATSTTANTVFLEVTFFESEILRLLTDESIPVWSANRPLTLVWLVEQDASGQRRLVSENEPLSLLVRDQAESRGIPLLFPLLDFDDMRELKLEELWNLDSEHIRLLSRRYGVESVLVFRVFSSLGNEYLGRSLFSFQGREFVQDLYGESLEELVGEPVAQVAEELAAYYSVFLTGTQSEVKVKMKITEVKTLKHYADLMRYVGGLADVNSVNLNTVHGDTIELELVTGGQIRQIVETIALDRNLVATSDLAREENGVVMQYRWRE